MSDPASIPSRLTIVRVEQKNKWLYVWTSRVDLEGNSDCAFRNGWRDKLLWDDDDHYDEIMSYGLSGLVVEFEDYMPSRIFGRQDVWDRIGDSPSVNAVRFTEDSIEIRIAGAKVWVRAPMSKRLLRATPSQREDFEYLNIVGLSWPEIDEDLSVAGILRDAIRWWPSDGPYRGPR